MTAPREEKIFVGNGVSPGLAMGQALRLDSNNRAIFRIRLASACMEPEIDRFRQALQASKDQLEHLRRHLEAQVGGEHSYILDVHLLMLEDKPLINEIESIIKGLRCNAEWAVRQATDRIRRAYATLEDEYFRERGNDVENVVERILSNLTGDASTNWSAFPQDLIVASHSFNPSTFATIELKKLRGLALESGGRTSHTAIIARGLRIPAVMEIPDLCSHITSGDQLLIDGDEGVIIRNPVQERLERFQRRLSERGFAAEHSVGAPELPAMASDGIRISLLANIDLPREVDAAISSGAEGVGLFRSELLFYTNPKGFPTIAEQVHAYEALVRSMAPHRVAVRTLDAGGDKSMPGAKYTFQLNPSMGLRGIRLSLQDRVPFCEQLEAILLASRAGTIEVVLPMITSVEEVRETKMLISQIEDRIASVHGWKPGPLAIGAMIEVPAAVLVLESIAAETDFICVGTNDLIQYMLAVDRANPHVAHLFQPLHPSVLQCLKRIADVSAGMSKQARICGEMSANPLYVVLLMGMGFTQFSMNSLSIPLVRRLVHAISTEECRKIAECALKFRTASEIADYLIESVKSMVQIDISPFIKEVRLSAARAALTYAP